MRSVQSLAVTASVLALVAASPALAQSQESQPTQPASQDSPVEPTPTPADQSTTQPSTNLAAENGKTSEPIVVTGSRIRRPDFSTPNPVQWGTW